MITVGVMLALTSIIGFNQSRYTSGAALKNLANNLGLSLRQAQVYGISVKEYSPGAAGGFSAGYGVEFDISSGGDNTSYIFFADRSPLNGRYDGNFTCPIGGASECLDKITMSGGNTVSKLCTIVDASGTESCNGITRLDISFVRPAIEAKISYNGGPADPSLKGARVELTSIDGKKNSVVVYVTGQISVR
ncbi:hypothetical protein KW796_01730 [Candidatus Parcubacteria bacterium]|nr:hypothetical protein [Candidatus Parcubacteria bacterium]